MHTSVTEMRTRIRRIGLWSAARWAAKRGIPIETVLMAIRG